jgi:tRNA A-37 threonylcarbamoyl transferase component Bud32
MPDLASADQSGRLLEGKYRLQRLLGKGGMGEVYEATHELIGRKLAVKLLHSEYLADDEKVRRFEREAKIATAIGHDHIIEITDMGRTEQGDLFIAMEYLEGKDLACVLQAESKLDPRRVCHIAIQILSALEAAHPKGIVHRDLKPANIFLVSRGGTTDYVKILDFGISKVRDPRGNLDSGNTRNGALLGTPLYMSPEQALGSTNITPATDIFSVGVLMYEMLSGALPFRAPSLPKLLHRIIREEPQSLSELVPEAPEDLCQAIAKAMAKPPEERFPSAADMRRALRAFSPETSLVAGLRTTRLSSRMAVMQEALRKEGTKEPPKPSTRRRGAWVVVVAGVCLTLIGLALMEMPRNGSAEAHNDSGVVEGPMSPKKDRLAVPMPANAQIPPEPEKDGPRTGELTIIVAPSDAEILVDEVSIGVGSKEAVPIPIDSRKHNILVRRQGYADYRRTLTFESSLHLEVILEPLSENQQKPEKLRSVVERRPGSGPGLTPTSASDPTTKDKNQGKRVIDEKAPW